jgi:hypothetical protein
MQARWVLALGVVGLAGVATGEPDVPGLAAGVRLGSAGKPIDVDIGHAAPFVVDWDEDGRLDLLVGQFGEGKLRLYRSEAGASAARLAAATFVQVEGKEISVPSG